MSEALSSGVFVLIIVAIFMVGYGIYQYKNDKPVHFYSLESPPVIEDKEVMKKWNHVHGIMWIIYGIIFLALFFIALYASSLLIFEKCAIFMIGGPLALMILVHEIMKKDL